MDPYVIFDCLKVLPDRFALTLSAAARSRALGRGAEPRLDPNYPSVCDLALHEIAAGMFGQTELGPFLCGKGERSSLPPPDSDSMTRDGGSEIASAAAASRCRETAH